ncbi:VOC family protein [Sphingomonas sp. M1-B02]|nr:VOC family protein [Sphingomonas sp. S6-11]
MPRISYVELPVHQVAKVRDFYAQAFGFGFTDFGPDYAATTSGDVHLGLNGSDEGRPTHPFALVEVDNLEAAEEAVFNAGGTVTVPIYAYPGGRRFHFSDPDGNELGVFVNEPEA